MFFRVHVFQRPRFSGSRFFWVPGYSGSRFLIVQAFLGPGFSGSWFFWVPGYSGSWFFTVQAFLDPRSGSRFFRVWVKGLGPGFRSSLQRYIVVKFIFHFNRRSHHPAQKRKKKFFLSKLYRCQIFTTFSCYWNK